MFCRVVVVFVKILQDCECVESGKLLFGLRQIWRTVVFVFSVRR